MSLGTNILLSAVKAETGVNSNKGSELVGAAGLNKFSYYAPGILSVNGPKDIVLTPPVSNFKAGDFRLYNHNALAPVPPTYDSQNWGPSYANLAFNIVWFPNTLNIKSFVEPGDYITVKFYTSSANRAAESNPWHVQQFSIPFSADVPLTGHTRQSLLKVSSTGANILTITNFNVIGLADPDQTLYGDIYISDIAQNRKINFGDSAGGYFSINFHKRQQPYAFGQNTNVPYPPSGYTAIFPAIYSAATPVCSAVSQLNQTEGSSNYLFYVMAKAIHGAEVRVVALTSVDLVLTLGGVRTIMASGVSMDQYAGRLCSGTLAEGGVWNDIGAVTFENAVIEPVPAYVTC